MSIIMCRYVELQYALAGYFKTGVQLVGYDGTRLFPSGLSDDIGLYYFIPKLVRFCGVSLYLAINFFFYGIVCLAFVLGLTGFFLLSRSWLFRGIVAGELVFFSYLSCRGMTDTYLVSSSLAISVVPLALFFARRGKSDCWYGLFVFFCGVAAGYAQYIRSYSSGAVLLFLVLSIFFLLRVSFKQRFVLCAILGAGLLLPIFHFSMLLEHRKQYFGSSYEQFEDRHVFWHTLYAGLGFLNNKYGIKWDDATVCAHAREVNQESAYPSRAYEKKVKQMFFDLLKKNPHFVMQTLFAKLGVIVYYLLLFANVGLIAAFFYRKPWQVELLFWCALVFSSLFGLMALPGRYYLLGFLAFALLYGLVSLEYALDQRGVTK